ncbi:hypothetical protein DH2020_037803 [Rehmannia glutinosa]|uniref:Homeobox-leucine zipper protein n=1 Tax=Rehmannia glutinosa TaxID=99300 RepID=A0ABR0V1L3_REHGL
MKPRRRRKKNNGGGGCDGEMRKRKLSEEQVSMLERSFGNEQKLESERKDRLAAEIGLDPRQVAVWFQNRRARWRSKKLEEEYSKLRSEHETTVVEKCRIETEEQLDEARKEIQRLWSIRMDLGAIIQIVIHRCQCKLSTVFLGDFGIRELENVFYNNYDYVDGLEWDIYSM